MLYSRRLDKKKLCCNYNIFLDKEIREVKKKKKRIENIQRVSSSLDNVDCNLVSLQKLLWVRICWTYFHLTLIRHLWISYHCRTVSLCSHPCTRNSFHYWCYSGHGHNFLDRSCYNRFRKFRKDNLNETQ